jgi:hypothetical protein
MIQELGSQKRKGQMQMWTEYEEMVNQQCYLEVLTRLQESGGKELNSGLTNGFSTMTWAEYEQMVNQQCYLEVLTRLQESGGKDLNSILTNGFSTTVHEAERVLEFLTKKSITKTDHPPYSPDLAPCDFWLFTKLKNVLKGQRFADIPDI